MERARPLFAKLFHQRVFLEGEGRPIFELSSPQHGHGPEIGLGIHPLFDCRPDIGRFFLPFPRLFPHRSRVELGQDLALGLFNFEILFPCVALKVLFGHPGFFSRSEQARPGNLGMGQFNFLVRGAHAIKDAPDIVIEFHLQGRHLTVNH